MVCEMTWPPIRYMYANHLPVLNVTSNIYTCRLALARAFICRLSCTGTQVCMCIYHCLICKQHASLFIIMHAALYLKDKMAASRRPEKKWSVKGNVIGRFLNLLAGLAKRVRYGKAKRTLQNQTRPSKE